MYENVPVGVDHSDQPRHSQAVTPTVLPSNGVNFNLDADIAVGIVGISLCARVGCRKINMRMHVGVLGERRQIVSGYVGVLAEPRHDLSGSVKVREHPDRVCRGMSGVIPRLWRAVYRLFFM